jgi:hypothetical protein
VVHALELEKAILGTMRALGMTPTRAAADLGLTPVKLEKAREFNWDRLTKKEQQQFEQLVEKAETYEAEWSDDA